MGARKRQALHLAQPRKAKAQKSASKQDELVDAIECGTSDSESAGTEDEPETESDLEWPEEQAPADQLQPSNALSLLKDAGESSASNFRYQRGPEPSRM